MSAGFGAKQKFPPANQRRQALSSPIEREPHEKSTRLSSVEQVLGAERAKHSESNGAQVRVRDAGRDVRSPMQQSVESPTSDRADQFALCPAVGVTRQKVVGASGNSMMRMVRTEGSLCAEGDHEVWANEISTTRGHDYDRAPLRHFRRWEG